MNCENLRVVYAGTPDFAVPTLKALIKSSHTVIAVYTQPDRPAGRGRKLTASPVKQCAVDNHIPVYQPQTLKSAPAQKTLRDLDCDIMVVAAYGLILPGAVLEIPPLGCINIHASLLPRWRGAAPIQRAIQAGDNESGVTIMQMAKGLDTGDMLLKKSITIEPGMTAGELHDKIAELGSAGVLQILPAICKGELNPAVQDHALANYAEKITKQEAEINWHDSAINIHRMICAFNPFPVAFTRLGNKVIRIWRSSLSNVKASGEPGKVISTEDGVIHVSTGDGVLGLETVQLQGKKAVSAAEFLNGRHILGECLTATSPSQ